MNSLEKTRVRIGSYMARILIEGDLFLFFFFFLVFSNFFLFFFFFFFKTLLIVAREIANSLSPSKAYRV